MISYSTAGEGFPVLYLHGFCESFGIWDHVKTGLPQGFTHVFADIPGFGNSPAPADPLSLHGVAAQLLEWLASIGHSEYAVIGHSMGGYIALAMASMSQDKCMALGLFHSTAAADSPEKKINRTKSVEFINKNGKEAFLKTFIPGLYHHPGPWEKELHDMIYATPEDSILRYTCAMRDRPSYTEWLKTYSGPTLFVAGEYDTFIPASGLREQVAGAKNPMYVFMEDTGHLGMLENPEASARIITDFLSGVNY